MIPEQLFKQEQQKLRNEMANYMIREGIKDGSLKSFIDAKVNLVQARAYHYFITGVINNE
jgi:hypothetical protein